MGMIACYQMLTWVTASAPEWGNPLSEAVVGSEKFIDDEELDYISYISSDGVNEKWRLSEKVDDIGVVMRLKI